VTPPGRLRYNVGDFEGLHGSRIPEPVGLETRPPLASTSHHGCAVLSTVRWATAHLVPFDEPGFPVLIGRISCSFSSSNEVVFSFPLRYLFAIGYLLSYLALDGQHHPYSVSTFKLTYSRLGPLPARRARSCITHCALGTQPMSCTLRRLGTRPSTTGPTAPKGVRDSVSGYSLFARSY